MFKNDEHTIPIQIGEFRFIVVFVWLERLELWWKLFKIIYFIYYTNKMKNKEGIIEKSKEISGFDLPFLISWPHRQHLSWRRRRWQSPLRSPKIPDSFLINALFVRCLNKNWFGLSFSSKFPSFYPVLWDTNQIHSVYFCLRFWQQRKFSSGSSDSNPNTFATHLMLCSILLWYTSQRWSMLYSTSETFHRTSKTLEECPCVRVVH